MTILYGYEFEVASDATDMLTPLRQRGWVGNSAYLHGYHCDCGDCGVWPGEDYDGEADSWEPKPAWPLHAQTDSSCGGEFITRILDTFEDGMRIAQALVDVLDEVDGEVNSSCGLHVHVSSNGRDSLSRNEYTFAPVSQHVALGYLYTERFISDLIAPGSSRRKRDMNRTLLTALREWAGRDTGYMRSFVTGNNDVRQDFLRTAIGMDRHVDLNYSRRNETWEFRVFNSTSHAWRIELAFRLAVAFVQHATALVRATTITDDEMYSILNGHRYTTMCPRMTFSEFVALITVDDDRLAELIARQSTFMSRRYIKDFDPDVLPGGDEPTVAMPEPAPPRRRATLRYEDESDCGPDGTSYVMDVPINISWLWEHDEENVLRQEQIITIARRTLNFHDVTEAIPAIRDAHADVCDRLSDLELTCRYLPDSARSGLSPDVFIPDPVHIDALLDFATANPNDEPYPRRRVRDSTYWVAYDHIADRIGEMLAASRGITYTAIGPIDPY